MQNFVNDLFRLPSLRRAKLIAGKAGIYRSVHGATILEMTELGRDDSTQLLIQSLKPGEMMITALYNIKDDVEKQLNIIQTLCELHSSGLIIFYYGHIVKMLDQQVLALCNRQSFPLIVLEYDFNKDVSYADVLNDIFSLRKHGDESYLRLFVSEIWKIRQDGGTVEDALRHIAEKNSIDIAVIDQSVGNVLTATMEREELSDLLSEESGEFPMSAARSEWKHGNIKCYGQRYDTGTLETNILLLLPISRTRKADKIERIFFSVKLCIDFWRRELVLTQGDVLISDIVQGNLQRALVDLEYYRQPGSAAWNFWVFPACLPAGEVINDAKARLRGEAVTYVSGSLQGISVILFSRKKTESGSVLDGLMEDGLKACPQCQIIYAKGILAENEMFRLLQLAVRQFPSIMSLFPYRQLIGRFDLLEAEACKDAADDEAAWVRAQQVLQPLIEYDKRRQGMLLNTLSVFLIDCNRDCQRAAGLLHAHPNTIQYRMKRAAELLDSSFEQTSAMAGIYHALCLYRQNQKKITYHIY